MSDQQRCTGLLVFRQIQQQRGGGAAAAAAAAAAPAYESRCFGVSSSVAPRDVVDLEGHHETSRDLAVQHRDAQLFSFACLGQAVHQQGPTISGGTTPPPFCLGVEFLRVTQAAMRHHQQQQQQQQQGLAAAAPGAGDPAVPAHHLPAASSSFPAAHQQPQPAAAAAAAYHSAQHDDAHSAAPAGADGAGGPRRHGPLPEPAEQQQSLQERLELLRERLAETDPLWFARAFSHRAALNWASMKRMAGDLAAAAMDDLGFDQEQDEAE